jgi:hypothetical protein
MAATANMTVKRSNVVVKFMFVLCWFPQSQPMCLCRQPWLSLFRKYAFIGKFPTLTSSSEFISQSISYTYFGSFTGKSNGRQGKLELYPAALQPERTGRHGLAEFGAAWVGSVPLMLMLDSPLANLMIRLGIFGSNNQVF